MIANFTPGPQSLQQFYETEYGGQVRRAYLMLGDLATAQDAVHDSFVSVAERWDQIDKPGPYLNRCVLNACRDRAVAMSRTEPSDKAGTERIAPADSRMSELWDVLQGLPFNQVAALVLRYFEGRTETEIAEQLEIRPGSVGPLITRGLRSLRRQVADEPQRSLPLRPIPKDQRPLKEQS